MASGMYPHVVALTPVSSEPDPTCVQCAHAIGDKTNGAVLDALEAALEHADVPAIRPRVEHAQIMDPKDIPRLGKVGGMPNLSACGKTTADCGSAVIASVQPIHA
jgi:hypothetical protein